MSKKTIKGERNPTALTPIGSQADAECREEVLILQLGTTWYPIELDVHRFPPQLNVHLRIFYDHRVVKGTLRDPIIKTRKVGFDVEGGLDVPSFRIV